MHFYFKNPEQYPIPPNYMLFQATNRNHPIQQMPNSVLEYKQFPQHIPFRPKHFAFRLIRPKPCHPKRSRITNFKLTA